MARIQCWKQHIQNNPYPKYTGHSKQWLKKYIEDLEAWDDANCAKCNDYMCWYRGTKQQLLDIAKAKLVCLMRNKRFNMTYYLTGKYQKHLEVIKQVG